MNLNPLDGDEAFQFDVVNPNPTSSKTKAGPIYRVSFEVDQGTWLQFMDADTNGMMMECIAIVTRRKGLNLDQNSLHIEGEPAPEAKYGESSRILFASGFLRAPAVWAELGTDEEYLDWVRRQPCAVCGKWSEWREDIGEGRCQAMHIRRVADGAGVGIKPEYCAVPGCHECHGQQHQSGENSVIVVDDRGKTEQADKAWFDKVRVKYVQDWAKSKIVEMAGVDHLNQVDPAQILLWAADHDLVRLLPKGFMDLAQGSLGDGP